MQVLRRQQTAALGRRVVADDVLDLAAVPAHELVDLVAQHEIALGERAVDGDHVAAELLEQRPNGRDPDSARDQQHLRTRARVGGEDAERPLGEHLRPDLQLAELRGVVSERLHRDPQ